MFFLTFGDDGFAGIAAWDWVLDVGHLEIVQAEIAWR
jgi:hypothetical protein